MNSITGIAILIVVLWIVIFVVYLYASRQHQSLQDGIDSVKELLDQTDDV